MTIAFTHTNEKITVVVDGQSFTANNDTLQYRSITEAILKQDWDAVREAVSPAGALRKWIGDAPFAVDSAKRILYRGQELPASLQQRIWAMANAGESPLPLMRFYERLALNPSYRSTHQLFDFMQHKNIPIEEDGHILTYKAVRPDMLDFHSSTFDNSPGKVLEMPRNQISDDPDVACHEGFHVGALGYVQSFGDADRTIVICRVDPADVVCVPKDHYYQKIRVCKYTVIGFHTQPMPSTTVPPDYVGEVVVDDEDGEDGEEEYDAAPAEVAVDDEDEDDDEFPDEDEDDEEGDEDDDDEDDDDEDDDVFMAPPRPSFPESRPVNERVQASQREEKRKVPADPSRRLKGKNAKQLMEEPIDLLRKYASKLSIVGASKMSGGKTALVGAIMKYRRRAKK